MVASIRHGSSKAQSRAQLALMRHLLLAQVAQGAPLENDGQLRCERIPAVHLNPLPNLSAT